MKAHRVLNDLEASFNKWTAKWSCVACLVPTVTVIVAASDCSRAEIWLQMLLETRCLHIQSP